jgi:nucleoid-associated protein YgaU
MSGEDDLHQAIHEKGRAMVIGHGGMQMTDAELLSHLLTGTCELDEQLLAALLEEGLPPALALRRATRGWWHGGAALLLGSALALSSLSSAVAREPAAPLTLQTVAAPAGADVASAAASVTAGARAAAPPALAGATLTPGLTLLIPELSDAAQQGTTPTGQLQTYRVQSGDSLWSIAQQLYGNGALWSQIYNANQNQIANPNLIFPNQVLNIPASSGGTLTPGTTPPTTNPPGNQTGGGAGQYTVRPGDSLWSIAQAIYGNGGRWSEIYNANSAKIGPNPGLIFAGIELTIPR